MGRPPVRLRVLRGGRAGGAPTRPGLDRAELRVLQGGRTAEMERALAEAVEAARQIRQEIERRIARALQSLDDA